jgi:hypothetical protein
MVRKKQLIRILAAGNLLTVRVRKPADGALRGKFDPARVITEPRGPDDG